MLHTPAVASWDDDTEDPVDQWSAFSAPDLNFVGVGPIETYVINPDIGPMLDGFTYYVNVEIKSIDFGDCNFRAYLGAGASEIFNTVGTHRFPITADFSTNQNIRIGNEPTSTGQATVELLGVELVNIREMIVAAVVTRLTGLTTTGDQCFRRRAYPHGVTPALNILSNEDEPDYDSAKMGGCAPLNRLAVRVQASVKPGEETLLNTIASEVDVAMYTDQNFGGLAVGVERSTVSAAIDGDGDQSLLVGDLVYDIFYRTAEGAPDIAV